MENFGAYQQEAECIFETIVPLVHKSLEVYNSLHSNQIKNKSDGSPVSISDYALQILIVDAIHKRFPNDKFFGEEDFSKLKTDQEFYHSVLEICPKEFNFDAFNDEVESQKLLIKNFNGISKDSKVWVIDPIDGTEGFTNQGDYAIATAVLVNLETVLSCTAWPTHSNKYTKLPFDGPAIFCSCKGCGSYAYNLSKEHCIKIHLDSASHIENNLLFSNANGKTSNRFNHLIEELKIEGEIPMISMSKAFVLATGNAVLFPKRHGGTPIRIWDVAPFELFLRESGCITSNLMNQPIQITEEGLVIGGEDGLIFTAKDLEYHKRAIIAYAQCYPSIFQAIKHFFGF